MKKTVRALGWIGLLAGFASFASAATMSMTGMISDSMCGASHAKMMAMHKALKTDRDCTLGCVKAGAKYVFVSGGKVFDIANQDFAELQKEAGMSVRLTGTREGNTITVTKVAMAIK